MANKDFNIKINHLLLVWARESVRIAPAYAAQELKMTEEEIKKLEEGTLIPTYNQLLEFSKLYGKPIGAFLLNMVPEEKPLPKDYRTVQSQEVNELHDKTLLSIRRVRGLVEDAIELRKEMGVILPKWDYASSLNENVEEVAINFRKLFNLLEFNKIENENNALDYLITQFENSGILVFQTSLTQDEVRGFSLTDEAVPVIVIRRADRQTAKPFTIFHELGHILLHDGGICNFKEKGIAAKVEKWCNQLAASILIPLENLLIEDMVQFQKRSGNKYWQLMTLTRLGQKYHVGPEVVLRRLYNANLTTKEFYEEKHEKWNSGFLGGRGGGKPRDRIKEQIKEKGKNFTRLALEALDKQKISIKDFADYMDVKIDQINKIPTYL
ncbi:MAG: ImmA/IrrE family metallo-endopeptidase [Chitinophagales bacterium]